MMFASVSLSLSFSWMVCTKFVPLIRWCVSSCSLRRGAGSWRRHQECNEPANHYMLWSVSLSITLARPCMGSITIKIWRSYTESIGDYAEVGGPMTRKNCGHSQCNTPAWWWADLATKNWAPIHWCKAFRLFEPCKKSIVTEHHSNSCRHGHGGRDHAGIRMGGSTMAHSPSPRRN